MQVQKLHYIGLPEGSITCHVGGDWLLVTRGAGHGLYLYYYRLGDWGTGGYKYYGVGGLAGGYGAGVLGTDLWVVVVGLGYFVLRQDCGNATGMPNVHSCFYEQYICL